MTIRVKTRRVPHPASMPYPPAETISEEDFQQALAMLEHLPFNLPKKLAHKDFSTSAFAEFVPPFCPDKKYLDISEDEVETLSEMLKRCFINIDESVLRSVQHGRGGKVSSGAEDEQEAEEPFGDNSDSETDESDPEEDEVPPPLPIAFKIDSDINIHAPALLDLVTPAAAVDTPTVNATNQSTRGKKTQPKPNYKIAKKKPKEVDEPEPEKVKKRKAKLAADQAAVDQAPRYTTRSSTRAAAINGGGD
ncbi:hypothetical protein B0H11DRAFT_1933520 [Mycena galericulata]|nr:hypothetical protein B0H11DRAFT_1933520 [Mycena galericulata]